LTYTLISDGGCSLGWLPSLRELFGKAAAPDSAPVSDTPKATPILYPLPPPLSERILPEAKYDRATLEKERQDRKEQWAADEEKWAAERTEKIEQMMREGLRKKFASESDPSAAAKGSTGLELPKDSESPLPSQPMTDEAWAEQRDKRIERMREDLKSKAHAPLARTNDFGLTR
jgi:hypothetical protein